MKGLRSTFVAAWLALAALPALADPTSLVAFAVTLGTSGTAYATYGAIAAFVIAAAGAYFQGEKARRRARDSFNAGLRDRTLTVRGVTEPRRMVLGRQPVGGVVAFIGTTGANKEQLVMVIALAAHECDGIEQIYFDDVPVEIVDEFVQTAPYGRTDTHSQGDAFVGDGVTTVFPLSHTPLNGNVGAVQTTGEGSNLQSISLNVTSVVGTNVTISPPPVGPFTIGYQYTSITSFARVRTFLGGAGQTVDAVVQSLFPGQWDANHPMSGCAGLAVFFTYNEDVFQTDVQVKAIVRGAKCYDPRKDSTVGGSGAHRLANPSTWEWTENPALEIGYAAMSPLCGRQAPTSVNWSRLAVAANVCDTQVDYSTWGLMADESGELLTDENDEQLLV